MIEPLDGVVEVGVGVDDAGRVAAEFEDDFLLAGAGLQVPADRGRAGEAQQLEPFVGREQVGAFAVAGQNRKRPGGQIGLGENLADDDRPDRRAARRLQHERAAHRDAPGRFCGRPG